MKIPGIWAFLSLGIFIPGIRDFFVGWDIPTKNHHWFKRYPYSYVFEFKVITRTSENSRGSNNHSISKKVPVMLIMH